MRPLFALGALLLQGCIFYPHTTHVYDDECKVRARQMTLKGEPLLQVTSCSSNCEAVLVVLGAVSAASVVVSGTIVVAGNAVYWFEKQGHCQAARSRS
jgi:hypothetical protein